ncbi:MAG TPA: rhodanese-like domain-containing protein [bacterium]|nr:rhodanese-like domain-containing protein [bacterium]
MPAALSVSDLKARLDRGEDLQLVDVRSPSEYLAGHLPGALNIPMDRCEARLDDLHAGRPVVLICQSGMRATVTSNLLAPHRPQALVLEGGTAAWRSAGLPVVVDSKTRWSLERQTRLGAGLLVLLGAIGSFVWPPAIALAIFVGCGLTFAGATDICPMGLLVSRAPWNQAPASPRTEPAASAAQ